MDKNYRIALGSIIIECNQLGGSPATLDQFRRSEYRLGPEVLEQSCGVVGGALEVLREQGAEIAPLVVATTCPSGPLTSDCYRKLKAEMLDRLRQALPVDGVLLPLHGAAVAEDVDDLEGDLLTAVRGVVGPGVAIVATLDLHADVTKAMVYAADALLGWETYPHRDTYETGQRGARMILDIVTGRCRPAMAMAKVPVLVGALHGGTDGEGPFADVMRFAKAQEGRGNVVSTSVFLVHPYLDLPEMGGGGLVITDGDPDKAQSLASELARQYWGRRFELEPVLHTPAEAVAQGLRIAGGPVLLVETADCCGGGAAGDSVATLKALLDAQVQEPSLVPVVDPEVAAECHHLGVGHEIVCQLGHKIDPQWGKPISIRGTIATLSEGRFTYQGGVWGGQEGNMGPTAVVQVGAVQVLVASRPTYDWKDEQFRSLGLDVEGAKFIVAKNPMNYRMTYGAIATGTFLLDTRGPTPATMRHFAYRRRQRPYFPADSEIAGLTPTVFCSPRRFG